MENDNYFTWLPGESLKNMYLSNVCTAYLNIRGMESPECVVRIYEALASIRGVIRVGIVLEKGIAAVVYHIEQVSTDALIKAIANIECAGREPYQADIWMLTDTF